MSAHALPSTGSVDGVGWMPCSDLSVLHDDPLAGTSGYGERWFLVEIDGAWGTHGFLQSRLEPTLARSIVTRVEGAGIRPLAIRRTGRRADERRAQKVWRWALVDARAGRESVRWGEVADPAELAIVPLDGSSGTPSTEPIICVCTHARHDQCCAVKGRPAVAALARAYPEWTWECSHLGGDRFAATMILFPHALHYGRVPAARAAGIVDAYRRGDVVSEFLRGRSSQPNAVQAAEAFARAELDESRIDAFRLRSSNEADGDYRIEFDSEHGIIDVRMSAALSEPLLSTCESTRPVRVRQFVLESVNAANGR